MCNRDWRPNNTCGRLVGLVTGDVFSENPRWNGEKTSWLVFPAFSELDWERSAKCNLSFRLTNEKWMPSTNRTTWLDLGKYAREPTKTEIQFKMKTQSDYLKIRFYIKKIHANIQVHKNHQNQSKINKISLNLKALSQNRKEGDWAGPECLLQARIKISQ